MAIASPAWTKSSRRKTCKFFWLLFYQTKELFLKKGASDKRVVLFALLFCFALAEPEFCRQDFLRCKQP